MRVAMFTLAAFLPAIALAAPAPPISWGKPGVSLATYRAESIGCAMRAYYTDVGDTEAAKAFVTGSRQLDTLVDAGTDAISYAQIAHSVHADERIKELKIFQGGIVAKCLADHGYHRFHLTDDQRKHLETLKIGSDARHAYLHDLAANPDILSSQAEPDPPAPAQP